MVSITSGNGQFVISPAGLAGELAVNVAVNVTGVRFNGGLKLRVNNTTAVPRIIKTSVTKSINVSDKNEHR